ncbi:hypothetical protein PVAP13_2NG005500 [Panicum virgatum]|uniref:Uncharacterized protein n=1 Tax=Panicum virgatum TaxID=38727 RepID=A0A8T0V394_PANVG|nr:hypothetical protein PVAP13_2NG005500 [Panicum virgatum]
MHLVGTHMLAEKVVNLRRENEQLKYDQSFKMIEIEDLKQKLALHDAQLKELCSTKDAAAAKERRVGAELSTVWHI